MNTTHLNQIGTDIQNAYGSLSSPNWSFIKKRYTNHPYVALIERLADVGATQETTDLNDDVSVVVFIAFNGGKGITIRLSLVGKYACVSNSAGEFLSLTDLEEDDRSRRVLNFLKQEKIAVIEPRELMTHIDFGEEGATIYEVLFSADEAVG